MKKNKVDEYQQFVTRFMKVLRGVIKETDVTIEYEEEGPQKGTIVLSIEKLKIVHRIPALPLFQKSLVELDLNLTCLELGNELIISREIAKGGMLEKEGFYERCRNNFYVTPQNYGNIKNKLDDRIYDRVEDIVLPVNVDLGICNGQHVTSIIPDEVTETCDKSRNEIINEALVNTSKLNPLRVIFRDQYVLDDMDEDVEYLTLDNEQWCQDMLSSSDGLILTTRDFKNGAASIFYPGVIERLAQLTESRFLFITFPSDYEAVIHDYLYNATEFDINKFNFETKGMISWNRPSKSLFCYDKAGCGAASEGNSGMTESYHALYHLDD